MRRRTGTDTNVITLMMFRTAPALTNDAPFHTARPDYYVGVVVELWQISMIAQRRGRLG